MTSANEPTHPMSQGDRVPVPDPTLLTTIAVDRAIEDFKALMETKFKSLDQAVNLARENLDKQRADLHNELERRLEQVTSDRLAQKDLIRSQIQTLAQVTGEKFTGIDTRLAESKVALDAALAAAKEAVTQQNEGFVQSITKSELATQKQIDAMVQLMGTSNKSLDDKITDLKGRMDRGEGAKTSYAAMYIGLVAAGGLLLALGSFIYAVTR